MEENKIWCLQTQLVGSRTVRKQYNSRVRRVGKGYLHSCDYLQHLASKSQPWGYPVLTPLSLVSYCLINPSERHWEKSPVLLTIQWENNPKRLTHRLIGIKRKGPRLTWFEKWWDWPKIDQNRCHFAVRLIAVNGCLHSFPAWPPVTSPAQLKRADTIICISLSR